MSTEIQTTNLSDVLRKVNDIQIAITEVKHQLRQFRLPSYVAPQIKKITTIVETHYNLPEGTVYTRSRKREIVEARKICMLIAAYITSFSYAGIAAAFHQNHASVSNAKKVMRNLFEFDTNIRNRFVEICKELKIGNKIINRMVTKD